MEIVIKIPDGVIPDEQVVNVKAHLQFMVNRLYVGRLRYGGPQRRQKYLTRMRLEMRRYRETGNFENLLNLCNYAYLESQTPENRKFHFDPTAASATRARMGV